MIWHVALLGSSWILVRLFCQNCVCPWDRSLVIDSLCYWYPLELGKPIIQKGCTRISKTSSTFLADLEFLADPGNCIWQEPKMEAAAAQHEWLKKMQGTLLLMSDAVKKVSRVSLPNLLLQDHILPLRTLHSTFLSLSESLSLEQRGSHPHTETDTTELITAMSTFMKSLVLQLGKLGSRINSSKAGPIRDVENEVFWDLWSFLVAACSVLKLTGDKWPHLWPLGKNPYDASLFDAFSVLLAWLLPMTRGSAWTSMKQADGRRRKNDDLLLILSQPLSCFAAICTSPIPIMTIRIKSSSATFFRTMCCIISKQFTYVPVVVGIQTPQLLAPSMSYLKACSATILGEISSSNLDTHITLEYLLSIFSTIIKCLMQPNRGLHLCKHLSSFKDPAVLHLLKAVVIMLSDTPPAAQAHNLVMISISALLDLLSFSIPKLPDVAAYDWTYAHEQVLMKAGLPLDLNPTRYKISETDSMLLEALNIHMNRDQESLVSFYSLQELVVKSWELAVRRRLSSAWLQHSCPGAFPMTSSVVGLGKQCILHGMQRFQQYKRDSRRQVTHQPCITYKNLHRFKRSVLHHGTLWKLKRFSGCCWRCLDSDLIATLFHIVQV